MKKVFLLLLVSVLIGCDNRTIIPQQWTQAEGACIKNDGITSVDVYMNGTKVLCKNGATFVFVQ